MTRLNGAWSSAGGASGAAQVMAWGLAAVSVVSASVSLGALTVDWAGAALAVPAALVLMSSGVALGWRRLAALAFTLLAVAYDVTDSLTLGLPGGLALALAVLVLVNPRTPGPAALGAPLVLIGSAFAATHVQVHAGGLSLAYGFAPGVAALAAGALGCRTPIGLGVLCAALGASGAAALGAFGPELWFESSVGVLEASGDFAAPRLAMSAGLVIATGALCAVAARVRGQAVSGSLSVALGLLAVFFGLSDSLAALGANALGALVSDLLGDLFSQPPPPMPPPPAPPAPIFSPNGVALGAVMSGLVATTISMAQDVDTIVVRGSLGGGPGLVVSALLAGFGGALIGHAAPRVWPLAVGAALAAALVHPALEWLLYGDMSIAPALALAAVASAAVGSRWTPSAIPARAPQASSALADFEKATRAGRKVGEALLARVPRRRGILGWRAFRALSAEVRSSRDRALALSSDPSFSPLLFKLTETFYAGVPAALFGFAWTAVGLVQALMASGFSTVGLATAVYYGASGGLSSVVNGYVLPATFLLVAAAAAWPLTSGRTPAPPRGAGRRLYLLLDGAIGLWPQMIAALGFAIALQGVQLASQDGGEVSAWLAQGLMILGGVLAAPMILALLYLNAVRIPSQVATSLGSAPGVGLVGRLVAHYVLVGVVAAVLNTVVSGAVMAILTGLAWLLSAAVGG